MTKRNKAVFILLTLLILAGVVLFLFCYNQEGFTGSRIKNPDAYSMDIEKMNGTDLHTLELQKGDALQIRFETEKGKLYMEIKAPDGTSLYRGNGKETTDFTVTIPEDGVYPVVVVARHAKGSIHIRCVKETEGTERGNAAPPEEATDTMEPIPLSPELVGPWHLDQSKNDLAAFADSLDLFPGYGEWGASMEIRGNGEMSWYIGAEGWHGTYSVEKNTLHAQLVSDLEQSSQNWDMRITSENGTTGLEMDYQDMTIYWVYGDREEADEPWKSALAEDLFQKYGVLPEYYEDLGDGIYQVYVEVGGEIVPFVTVNSTTGDYHG